MNAALRSSYDLCRRITRHSGNSFSYSFYLLPRAKRHAMCALYAFMRHTDDLVDNAESLASRREALAAWRATLDRAFDGRCTAPLLPALVDTVERYAIPPRYLHDVIDGVEHDLDASQYETFAELEEYCYRVASVVGLACIHIWGFRGPEALEPARQCGIAFQLTNILRDLKEDAQQGRIYLPQEDLRRFGYAADELRCGVCDRRFRALMQFQIDRAERFYRDGEGLERWLEPGGRPAFCAMRNTYRGLLREIARRDGDVFSRRVTLGRLRRLQIAASLLAWPRPALPAVRGSST